MSDKIVAVAFLSQHWLQQKHMEKLFTCQDERPDGGVKTIIHCTMYQSDFLKMLFTYLLFHIYYF